jgi:hypothetical protein
VKIKVQNEKNLPKPNSIHQTKLSSLSPNDHYTLQRNQDEKSFDALINYIYFFLMGVMAKNISHTKPITTISRI